MYKNPRPSEPRKKRIKCRELSGLLKWVLFIGGAILAVHTINRIK